MKVVFSHKISGPAEEMIKAAGYQVEYGLDKVAGASAILSLLTDKITGEIMDAAGRELKIIANYAVGFDNIDLAAAKQRNIFVTNTPGGFTEAVAEHTMALILAVTKRIIEADKFVRDGKYHGWEPELFIGTQLYGKEIGIVGLGRIGSYVAKIAHFGFSMQIIYYSHKPNMEIESQMGAKFCDNLADLLQRVDVVSLHVPLSDETRHLIGKKELSSMKKSAILVNTARGPIVDEAALIQALKEGWIAGAGLDVFENESTLNSELLTLNNLVLTPHIASATLEARGEMSRIAAENIIAALSGKAPKDLVE